MAGKKENKMDSYLVDMCLASRYYIYCSIVMSFQKGDGSTGLTGEGHV